MKQAFLSWCRLFRVPNLLTVPGDPLAGFLLAGGVLSGTRDTLGMLAGVSVCLYAAGLAANDAADSEADRRERPDRPIPSGAISRRAAFGVAAALTVAAIGLAWLIAPATAVCALLLGVAVWGYDIGMKHKPVLGPATMGVCRGLNWALGATAAGGSLGAVPFWIGAAGVALYIASVTRLARRETCAGRETTVRYAPFISGLIIAAAISGISIARGWGRDSISWILVAMLMLYFLFHTVIAALQWNTAGARKPELIGLLIRGLVVYQAVMIAWAGYPLLAMVWVLIMVNGFRLFSRYFYAS